MMDDGGLDGVYPLRGSCRGATLIRGFYLYCKSRAEYHSDLVFIVACLHCVCLATCVLSLELEIIGALILFVRIF